MHSSAGCALHKGTTSKRALPTYQTADIYYNSFWLTTVRGYFLTKLAYYINFKLIELFHICTKELYGFVMAQTHHPRSPLSISHGV